MTDNGMAHETIIPLHGKYQPLKTALFDLSHHVLNKKINKIIHFKLK